MPPYQPIEIVFFHSLQKGPLNVDIRFGGAGRTHPGDHHSAWHCPEEEVVGSGSPEYGQRTPWVQSEGPIVRNILAGTDKA